MYVSFLPLQILTKKALDLEASVGSNAEVLCDTYVPTRNIVSTLKKMVEVRSSYSE